MAIFHSYVMLVYQRVDDVRRCSDSKNLGFYRQIFSRNTGVYIHGAGRHPKIFNLVSGLSANSVPQNLMVHHHFPLKKKAIDGHRLGSPLFSEFPEKFRHSQVICLFFRPAGSDSVRQVQQARESHCASLVAG